METRQRTQSLRWGLRVGRVAAAILALLLATSIALANVPTTGTFAGKDNARGQFVIFQRPGEANLYRDWAGVLRLQLDKNTKGDRQGPLVNVFCIQLFVLVSTGNTYFSNGPVTALQGGCYIRYLLAHYPAAGVTTTAEGAARQLAIWHFSDNLDLNTIQDAGIRARALALAAEAQTQVDTNGCPGTNAGLATLTITPSTATVPQGQPVPYTVQISPATAATQVNITVDGTAVLDNGTQAATLTFNQGVASFTVTNANAGTVNITAVVPYVMDQGTVFDSDRNPPTQRLVLGDGISLTATAQAQTVFQQATPTSTPLATSTPTSTPLATSTPTTPPGSTSTPTTPPGSTSTPTTPPGATNTPASTNTPVPSNTPVTATPGNGPDPTPTSTQTTSKTPRPTSPPGGGGSPTSTPSGNTTATPAPGSDGTPTPQPPAAVTPGQPTPNNGLTSSNQALVRPRSLPNTGAPAERSRSTEWLLLVGAALLVAGIALQRRSARR